MAVKLPPVDAVIIGFGWTGAIMAQQPCDAGLNVLALERGPWRDTATDFSPGLAQDERRYMWRHHLFQSVAYDTLTVRKNIGQQALPMRHLGSFLLGTGVGSDGVHWNGQIWRSLDNWVAPDLTGNPRAPGPSAAAVAPSAGAMRLGGAIYADVRAACHLQNGVGQPRLFPPLVNDAMLQQRDPQNSGDWKQALLRTMS